MAENKKGFVLYADLIHTVRHLSKEDAGELFMHILSYVNDENPTTDNTIVKISFEPVKQQLKRDLRKYEEKKLQWSEAGKASAEAKRLAKEKSEQNRSTESTDVEFRLTESTVTVKDKVKVTVKDINTEDVDKGEITHSVFCNRLLSKEGELDKEAIEISTKVFVTEELLKQFNANLTNQGKRYYHFSEYKKHLVNWIPKKPKAEQSGKSKNRTSEILNNYEETKKWIEETFKDE